MLRFHVSSRDLWFRRAITPGQMMQAGLQAEADREGLTAAQLVLATKKSLANASVGERARSRWKKVNKTAKLQVTIARSIMSEVRATGPLHRVNAST